MCAREKIKKKESEFGNCSYLRTKKKLVKIVKEKEKKTMESQQQHLNHNSLSPVANRSGEKSHRGNGLTPAEFLSDDDNSEHNIDNMGYTQEQTHSMNQQLVQLNPGLSFQQMQGHLQDQEQVSVTRSAN